MRIHFQTEVAGIRLEDPFQEVFAIEDHPEVQVSVEYAQYIDMDFGDYLATSVSVDCSIDTSDEQEYYSVILYWTKLISGNMEMDDTFTWITKRSIGPEGMLFSSTSRPLNALSCPSFQRLPNQIQHLFNTYSQIASRSIINVVNTIHWRMGSYWFPSPSTHWTEALWSLDGTTWKVVPPRPVETHWELGSVADRFVGNRIADVKSSLTSMNNMPISFSLLQEAYSLRNSSERASCIIAWSAVETAYKDFIIHSGVDTNWLHKSVQFTDFCNHALPVILKLSGRKVEFECIPQEMIGDLNKVRIARNRFAHAPNKESTGANIDIHKTIRLVADFIWILEYFSGRSWAIRYVQDSSLAKLKWVDRSLLESMSG